MEEILKLLWTKSKTIGKGLKALTNIVPAFNFVDLSNNIFNQLRNEQFEYISKAS